MVSNRKEGADRVRNEVPVTLFEALSFFPPSSFQRLSVNSLRRFCIAGKCKVRLDSVRIGGALHTSADAVGRFLKALDERQGGAR